MRHVWVWLKRRYGNRYDFTLLYFDGNGMATTKGYVYVHSPRGKYAVSGKNASETMYCKTPSVGRKLVEDSYNIIDVPIVTKNEIIEAGKRKF